MALLGCDELARWTLKRCDDEDHAYDVAVEILPAIAKLDLERLRNTPRRAPQKKERANTNTFLDAKREPWRVRGGA